MNGIFILILFEVISCVEPAAVKIVNLSCSTGIDIVCRTQAVVVIDEIDLRTKFHLQGDDRLEPSSVKELHLAWIRFGIDKSFAEFSKLNVLKISHSSLTRLNGNIFQGLKELKKLMLDGNEIKEVVGFSLPSLEKLFLAKNRIEILNQNSLNGLRSLKFLTLEDNQIFYIHKHSFKVNTLLEEMNLNRNDLRFLEPETFSNNPTLKELSLNHNQIKNLHQDIFNKNSNLEVLRLHHNKLHHLNKELFSSNLKLKWIELGENQLNFIDPKVFQSLPQIEFIDLSSNSCIDESFPDEMNFQHLIELTKRNCHFLSSYFYNFL